MGGEWGGTTIPTQVETMFEAIMGMDEAGLAPGDAAYGGAKYATYNFKEALEAAWDVAGTTSPYANAVLHDPNPELDEALDRLEEADVLVQMFDPETDWGTLLDLVKAKIDAALVWEDDIEDVVEAFDRANLPALQRSLARMSAQLCERGASMSTAHTLAAATLEKGHNDKVAEYRAQMTLEAKKLRATAIMQGVTQLFDAIRYRIEANRIMAVARLEFAKTNITANSDLVANQLKVDVEAERWNLNLLSEARASNLISGSPSLQRGLTDWQAGVSLLLSTAGSFMNVIPALAG